MSVSLYRKYRPQNFAGIIGQSAAVSVLTNSIAKKRVGHAYLFSGSRGCGKTSAARIFAKAINCEDPQGFEPCGKCRNCTEITAGDSLDVIEIDGASNNGVDSIRGLKENVTLAPFNSRYKIYIIDEVHMLSQGAFNALLKTLEEPPEHVIFIMATTEPHKVPVTIRSRCQHIPFRSITPDDIFARIKYVCQQEGFNAEDDALREISRQADGALRDALSILEQVSASGDVTLSSVEAVLGAGSRVSFEKWIKAYRETPQEAYTLLRSMVDGGASGIRIFEELFAVLRDLWLVSKWKNIVGSLGLSEQEKKFLVEEAVLWKTDELYHLMNSTLKALTDARTGIRSDILLGMFMFSIDDTELSPVNPPPTARHQPMSKIPPREEAPVATKAPINDAPVTDAVIPPEDTALKAEILNAAHDKNFGVWCAMFDASPFVRGNDLVLSMKHRYTYAVMRIDRNAADIAEIFTGYDNVVLRYGKAEYICPRRPTTIKKPQPAPIPNLPEPPKLDEPYSPPIPQPENEPEPSRQPSAFDTIINGLKFFDLKPEVILTRHNDTDDDETSTDITEEEED